MICIGRGEKVKFSKEKKKTTTNTITDGRETFHSEPEWDFAHISNKTFLAS